MTYFHLTLHQRMTPAESRRLCHDILSDGWDYVSLAGTDREWWTVTFGLVG